MAEILTEERRIASEEREALMTQIGSLVATASAQQERRLEQGLRLWRTGFDTTQSSHADARTKFSKESEQWTERSAGFIARMTVSRDNIKSKLKGDFAAATDRTASLRAITTSVHDSTTKIVEEQVQHLDTELRALDDIVEKIQEQNNTHHQRHVESLQGLATDVRSSYDSMGSHFTESFSRVTELDADMTSRCSALRDTLPAFDEEGILRLQLRELRQSVEGRSLDDYAATGQTPQRKSYAYSSKLPRTMDREALLTRLRNGEEIPEEAEEEDAPSDREVFCSSISSDAAIVPPPRSPTKALVFTDAVDSDIAAGLVRPTVVALPSFNSSLRELDINTIASQSNSLLLPPDSQTTSILKDNIALDLSLPALKRQNTTGSISDLSKLPMKKRGNAARMTVAAVQQDRENLGAGMSLLSKSVGPGNENPVLGRRRGLRSQGST